MSDTPAVLVELGSLPEAVEESWRRWCDHVWLPARAAVPGVIAARRTLGVVGSIRSMVLYDLADSAVATSRAWREVDARIEAEHSQSDELRGQRAHVESVLYRQIYSSVESTYRAPEAEIIHGAFFEVPTQHHDEFNDWYTLEHLPAILKVAGYLNARRFQGVDDALKFLALYDVVSFDVADGKEVYDANQSPWSDRIRAKVVSARERRLFRVERLEHGSAGKA